jgi:hypothetical protein
MIPAGLGKGQQQFAQTTRARKIWSLFPQGLALIVTKLAKPAVIFLKPKREPEGQSHEREKYGHVSHMA